MSIRDLKPANSPLYRDEYLVEEDQMGDSGTQDTLIHYLGEVLQYFYRYEKWMVTRNRNHYHSALDNSEKLIVPDVAVFKGITIPPEDQPYIVSWDMRQGNKPAPPVVIEVSSTSTYRGDIEPDKKPRLYGLIGVREYFAYDPNRPQVWPRRIGKRLLGWRYDQAGQPQPIEAETTGLAKGWLWSEVLESWLGADGLYLRLYDREGNQRLTAAEALEAEEAKLQQAEQQVVDEQMARKQAEQQVAELQRQLEQLRHQQSEK